MTISQRWVSVIIKTSCFLSGIAHLFFCLRLNLLYHPHRVMSRTDKMDLPESYNGYFTRQRIYDKIQNKGYMDTAAVKI